MVYLILYLVVSHHSWKSGQEPGGSIEAETMEERCLLMGVSWLLPFAIFLYNKGPPAQGRHHAHGLKTPTLIIDQENASKHLPIGQSDGGIFSVEVPASQIIQTCVKLIN